MTRLGERTMGEYEQIVLPFSVGVCRSAPKDPSAWTQELDVRPFTEKC